MNLPPCIKAAASARDTDALDDIFAYFHTFGEEGLEPVLWSIGYLSLDNYEGRKNSALGMIKTSKPLMCFAEKPVHLGKYCDEACPLKDPKVWLVLTIKRVYLTQGILPTSRHLVAEFVGGEVFKSGDKVFLFYNPDPFLRNVSREFRDWFREKFGINLPLRNEDISEVFKKFLWGDPHDLIAPAVR